MAKRRLEMMTDAQREKLISMAGTRGAEMAEKGARAMSQGITKAGKGVAESIKSDEDTKTVKTEQARAEETPKLDEQESPYKMQEIESPLKNNMMEERKRRMRARMFTA